MRYLPAFLYIVSPRKRDIFKGRFSLLENNMSLSLPVFVRFGRSTIDPTSAYIFGASSDFLIRRVLNSHGFDTYTLLTGQ